MTKHRMKSFLSLLLVAFLAVACAQNKESELAQQPEEATESIMRFDTTMTEADRLAYEDPTGIYGEDLQLEESISLADVLAKAEELEGQRVQVKATIKESCPKRGCWVNLEQGDTEMKVKVVDGEIVFPKSSVGREGIFEGVVERMEMDLEQTRKHFAHEAEETGQEFDPESITEPMTIWRIKGSAARIE